MKKHAADMDEKDFKVEKPAKNIKEQIDQLKRKTSEKSQRSMEDGKKAVQEVNSVLDSMVDKTVAMGSGITEKIKQLG